MALSGIWVECLSSWPLTPSFLWSVFDSVWLRSNIVPTKSNTHNINYKSTFIGEAWRVYQLLDIFICLTLVNCFSNLQTCSYFGENSSMSEWWIRNWASFWWKTRRNFTNRRTKNIFHKKSSHTGKLMIIFCRFNFEVWEWDGKKLLVSDRICTWLKRDFHTDFSLLKRMNRKMTTINPT